MAELHVLRVFVNPDGGGGNPLGVFVLGNDVPESRRQAIATDLNFSETVFVEDPERGVLRIFTPADEIPFAGHPTVGTAWLLDRQGYTPPTLNCRAGELGVRREAGRTYVSARAEWCPPFEYVRLDSPAEVDALSPTSSGETYFWAWIDEQAGTVRSRGFYPVHGIEEDEATGSAALALSARLGRELLVRQGAGSVLHARPLDAGRAEVGGVTELVVLRDYSL